MNDCKCKVCEYARQQAAMDEENERYMRGQPAARHNCERLALFQALRDAGIE